MKPSSFKSKPCIFEIGNGFLLTLLLSSLKSEMKQTVPFVLWIINVGAAHSKLYIHCKTFMFTNLFTSVLRVSSCTFGIGNGLAWYGWPLSRSSILYSVPV